MMHSNNIPNIISEEHDRSPTPKFHKNISKIETLVSGNKFIEACKNGRFDLVIEYISNDDENDYDNWGEAFKYAYQNGHRQVMRLLSIGGRNSKSFIKRAKSFTGNISDDEHIYNEGFTQACQNFDTDAKIAAKCQSLVNHRSSYCSYLEVVKLLLSLKNGGYISISCDVRAEQFKQACQNGQIELVELLMYMENDRHVRISHYYEKSFEYACVNGNVEMVKLLLSLEHDDEFKHDNHNGFRLACRRGQVEVVRFLLSLNNYLDYFNERAFIEACGNGHIEIVNLLLSLMNNIYDVNYCYKEGFKLAAENEHFDVIKSLLPLGNRCDYIIRYDKYVFMEACERGHIEIIKLLLSLEGNRYIDVHFDGERAFISACQYGHTELVKLFLSLKEDRYIDVHISNDCVFIDACREGHIHVVKLLLSLGGDRYIDVHTYNDAAFKSACLNRYTNLVELLLSLKGDRKINLIGLNLNNGSRQWLLKIMIGKIYRDRKIFLMRRKVEKYKKILVREIKSLPKGHLHPYFPGGFDYLNMLSKY